MALPPPSPGATCVVTGASSGIGVDIARELASRGHGVTLVARREDRLREVAAALNVDSNVRTEVVACDLGQPAERDRLVAEVAERGLEVGVLVNNAGFGSGGRFHELDREPEVEMVRLNVEAVVDLCSRWVPGMVERGRGAVLNVASVAAFQPVARQATYGASKAFVLSFTEALHSDLLGTGVTATALCPGPVRSEFMDAPGFEHVDGAPDFVWMTPAATARAGVRGLERGRRVVVPGVTNLATAIAGRHSPHGVALALARRFSPIGRR